MALTPLFRYASGAVAAGVLLAGCNAGSSQPLGGGVPATSRQVLHEPRFDAHMFALTNRLHKVPVRHLNHGKSWILPGAGKQWLLYVSDGSSGTVDIYNYRMQAGKLYGQITGFSAPYGQCVDHSGNVYIADLGAAKIYRNSPTAERRRSLQPPTITAIRSVVRLIRRPATSRSQTFTAQTTALAASTSSPAA